MLASVKCNCEEATIPLSLQKSLASVITASGFGIVLHRGLGEGQLPTIVTDRCNLRSFDLIDGMLMRRSSRSLQQEQCCSSPPFELLSPSLLFLAYNKINSSRFDSHLPSWILVLINTDQLTSEHGDELWLHTYTSRWTSYLPSLKTFIAQCAVQSVWDELLRLLCRALRALPPSLNTLCSGACHTVGTTMHCWHVLLCAILIASSFPLSHCDVIGPASDVPIDQDLFLPEYYEVSDAEYAPYEPPDSSDDGYHLGYYAPVDADVPEEVPDPEATNPPWNTYEYYQSDEDDDVVYEPATEPGKFSGVTSFALIACPQTGSYNACTFYQHDVILDPMTLLSQV